MTFRILSWALVALTIAGSSTAALADHFFVDHTQDSHSYIDIDLVNVSTDGYLEVHQLVGGEPGKLLDKITVHAGANDNLRFRHGEFPSRVVIFLYNNDDMLLDVQTVEIDN